MNRADAPARLYVACRRCTCREWRILNSRHVLLSERSLGALLEHRDGEGELETGDGVGVVAQPSGRLRGIRAVAHAQPPRGPPLIPEGRVGLRGGLLEGREPTGLTGARSGCAQAGKVMNRRAGGPGATAQ